MTGSKQRSRKQQRDSSDGNAMAWRNHVSLHELSIDDRMLA